MACADPEWDHTSIYDVPPLEYDGLKISLSPTQYELTTGDLVWKEQFLYGSSRLGRVNLDRVLDPICYDCPPAPNEPDVTILPDLEVTIGTVPELEYRPKSLTSWSFGQRQYEITNHLGNVTTVFGEQIERLTPNEDLHRLPWIINHTDYLPFGLQYRWKTDGMESDYRYGFNGKEVDKDVEWGSSTVYDYGFRVYDPGLARFLSVDPLTPSYPMLTPYQFASNRPIDGIDLDGLEYLRVVSYSFAPFETFGGGFVGDGMGRRFGDQIREDNGKENFRIGANVEYDLQHAELLDQSVSTTTSTWSVAPNLATAQSETNWQEPLDFVSSNGSMNLFFQMQGNDDALFWGYLPGFIDVKVNLFITPAEDNNSYKVFGFVYGDRFPANETYLEDKQGNKLFLGVSAPDQGAWHAPFTQLLGLANDAMSKFMLQINFNEDETFNSVELISGEKYSIEEWNKIFTDLDPRDPNVGTDVGPDGVDTEYDPDY